MTLVGKASDALEKQEALFGRLVDIKAKDKAAQGEYEVFISDTTTNGKLVRVTVKPKVEKKPGQ